MRGLSMVERDSSAGVERWAERAECAKPGMDPEWWFPERDRDGAAQALRVCRVCPVAEQCKRWVLEADSRSVFGEIWGVAGGMTQETRRLLKSVRASEGLDVSSLELCAGGCGRLIVRRTDTVYDPTVFAHRGSHGMCYSCWRRVRRRREREVAAAETAARGSSGMRGAA